VSSEEKAAFARRNGCDDVVYYRRESVVQRVRELTGGRGVGRVFEHVGGPEFVGYVGALGDWGTLVSFNGFSPLPLENLSAALREHMSVCPAVRQFSFHYYDHQRDARRLLMQTVIDALTRGEITPAIAARLPFSRVRHAHELLAAGSALGKIVMKPDALLD
jgi:NADPH2:quinone reductase